MPFSDWGELAFQFIVNNSTSKKVDEGLLIAIVGHSLSKKELKRTEIRLNKAGIKVSLIQAVMKIHEQNNPFNGMLDFGIPGEKGFLDAPAMKGKVVEWWYGNRGKSGTSPKFKTIKIDNRTEVPLESFFGNVCDGKSKKERVEDWQKEKWFIYFKAFWEAISNHFKPRLWPESSDEWLPVNKAVSKYSPVEKEKHRLMRATVLGLLQKAVLQVWADQKRREIHKDGKKIEDFVTNPKEFKKEIETLISLIPTDFFTELNYTGFDASKDLKADFIEQIIRLLEMTAEFADIKAKHRFWN